MNRLQTAQAVFYIKAKKFNDYLIIEVLLYMHSKKAAGGLHLSGQTASYKNILLCPTAYRQFPIK